MKTCLIHGCYPEECDCPLSISQADEHIEIRRTERLPPLVTMEAEIFGRELPEMPGPFLVTWRHERRGNEVMSSMIRVKCISTGTVLNGG